MKVPIKSSLKSLIFPIFFLVLALAIAGGAIAATQEHSTTLSNTDHQQFTAILTGDGQQYGQLFTELQQYLFPRLFLLILTIVPVFFFLHYVAVGPKTFDHDTTQIYCYKLFVRIVHWCAALSFSLLMLTGLMIVFASLFGGGSIGFAGRTVHQLSALVFSGSILLLFFSWLKEMLPALYDVKWIIIMGGYLSRDVKPVPAGKFNAGQKMWFGLATVGGGIMAVTGYLLYSHQGATDTLQLSAIIHNFLGAAMITMFLVHLYMSVVAIKGSLKSMISGYKSAAELKILHSKYEFKVGQEKFFDDA